MQIARLLRLDRPGPDGRVLIHLRICWQGNKVRLSSGERILPADWDKKNKKVKPRILFGSDINSRLDTYETGLKKFAYQQENNGMILTEEMVRAEVDRIRSNELGQVKKADRQAQIVVESSEPTISDFVKTYIQERSADRSNSWKDSVDIVGRHLDAFRPGLRWPDLKLATLNNFKVYMQDELNHSDATLEAYIGLLRGMLKYAGRSGLPVPGDWTYLEVRRVGNSLQPELQIDEVGIIRQATIYRPDGLPPVYQLLSKDLIEETRWYFLAACGTGLRHSDLWQLQNPRLTSIDGTPCIEVWQQKTKSRVPVPLNNDTYDLIKNPINRNAPLPLSYYNKSLKIIGEQAGLERMVRVGSYYKGQLLTEELHLHETVNSHMARRTFATVMTAGGMPTRTLQILMGHSSISSTEKYANVPSSTLIQQTISAWSRLNVTPSVTPQIENGPQML